MLIKRSENETVRIAILWTRETYFGLMLGDKQMARNALLRNPQSMIPRELSHYPFALHYGPGLELPPITCVALLALTSTEMSDEKRLVFIWFQENMFDTPHDSIVTAIRSIDSEKFALYDD